GESSTTYIDSHIFKPLRMRNTGYGSAGIPPPPEKTPLLLPSDVEQSLQYTSGGLYSTVEDLYIWDRAVTSGELVSQNSVRQMSAPYRDGYGLGWMVQIEQSRKLLTQGGGFRSYSASMLRYPDDDACVIVLSHSAETDTQRVSRDLAAILF